MRFRFAFHHSGLVLGTSLAFVACAVAREDPALPVPPAGEGAQSNDGGTSAMGVGGTSGSGGSGTAGSTANAGSAGSAGKSMGGSAGVSGGSSGGTSSGGSSGSNSGGKGGTISSGGSSGSAGASGGSSGTAGGSAGSANGSGGSAGTNVAGTSSAGTSSAGTGGTTMSGEVLFSDDFETSDAADWFPSADASAWGVVMDDSNVYEQGPPQVNMDRFSSAGDAEWTDVSIEARVKVTAFNGSSSSYFAGVYARIEGASNYYSFALRSDGKVSIRKGGSNLGSAEDAGIVEGEYFDVKFVARGSTLTGFINGAQVTQVTDSSIPNGAIGVGTRNTSAMFDDVRVTVP